MSSLQNQWFAMGSNSPSYELQGKTYAELTVNGNSVKSVELIPNNFITLNSSTSVVPSSNKTGSYITIINPVVGHKVYAKITTSNPNLRLCWYKSGTTAYDFVTGEFLDGSSSVSNVFEGVYTVTQDMVYSDGYMQFYYWIYNGLPTGNHTLTVQLIDLTELGMDSIINPVLFNATELGKLMSKRLVEFGNKIYSVDKDIVLSNGTAVSLTEPLRSVGDLKDSYSTSGKEIRKFAEVDLGSLEWITPSNGLFYISLYSINAKADMVHYKINAIISNKYTLTDVGASSLMVNQSYGPNQWGPTPVLLFKDTNYTDVATFKTAMQGVKLIYELATPIETTTDRLVLPTDTTILNAEYSKELRSVEFPVYAKKSELPYEYQEVEYLESTGTQWIDTMWIPQTPFAIEQEIEILDTDGDRYYGGVEENKYFIDHIRYYDTIQHYTRDNSGAYKLNAFPKPNDKFKAKCVWENDKIYGYLNDELKYTNNYSGIYNFTRTWYIFKLNLDTFPYGGGKIRIFNYKITQNNTLVRNFIPCYRKSDNVAGMYDLVNGQFYTNQGTGSFIVGNDVNIDIEITPKRRTKNLSLDDNPNNPDANYISSGGGTQPIQYSQDENAFFTSNHRTRDWYVNSVGSYTLSFTAKLRVEGSSAYAILANANGSFIGSIISKENLTSNYQRFYKTINITDITKPIQLTFYNTLYFRDIQLEEGSTATPYEPYYDYLTELKQVGDIKDTYTTLNGIDMNRLGVVDLGSLNWVYQSANTRWYVSSAGLNLKPPISQSYIANALCEKYTVVSFNTAYENQNGFAISTGTNANIFYFTTDSTNKPSGLMIYELAEPIKTKYSSIKLPRNITKFVDKNGVEVEYIRKK